MTVFKEVLIQICSSMLRAAQAVCFEFQAQGAKEGKCTGERWAGMKHAQRGMLYQ
jgi:hypothetical protein